MPNGISCAYFAARNHIYGKKEANPFKEGIAGIQATRTIDAVTSVSSVSNPVSSTVSNFFSKAAQIGRKLVYPLIIGSGIYNTVKSDDKVKTGTEQACGIGTMYLFEQVSERVLRGINSKLLSFEKFANNKLAKGIFYVAKGLAFVVASLSGYSVGSSVASKIVDKTRADNPKKTVPFPLEDGLSAEDIENTLFEDIMLK